MLTYRQVNAELQKLDPTAELVKAYFGPYHYFMGDSVRNAPTSSVMISRLNYLPLDSWVEAFKEKQEESKKWSRS